MDADPHADTFTVKVRNRNSTLSTWTHVTAFQYQLRVRVTPSPGLSYTATAPSGTSFDRATGIWDLGTLRGATTPEGNRSLEIRVTGRDARAGPAEDQCLTVEIAHIIPDLEEPHLPYTACMDHKALITAGPFDIFNWHDCLAETAYPCGNQPSLELVAVKWGYRAPHVDPQRVARYDIGDVHRARFRSDVVGPGNNTNNMVLQPEEVVVQVPDNAATRVTESGNTVWSTVNTLNLYIGQRGFDASWSGFKESVTVSGLDGTGWPGRWRMGTSDFVLLDAPDSSKAEAEPYDTDVIPDNGMTDVWIEFGALGTYVALFEIEATKSGTTDPYTDSGTYTFHVGPVSELEVRDDPSRSLAQPGRRAYTVVARNQGPDTAPAVQVTLTGVPDGAEAIASKGEYDPDTGIWTIGEMRDAESLQAEGEVDAEVLTIIPSSSGGDPITATIENTEDYSVVIDGTTHTAKYYDYLDHNNEAEVSLRSAPRTGPPGRPERPTVSRLPAVAGVPSFALVRWAPVEYLNGFRVSHYEVQRSSSPWETVADDVGGAVYLDMGDRGGQAQYRVRAVNEAGGHGPWSLASARGTGVLAAPTGFTATPGPGDSDRIYLSWFAPSGESGLHYRVEHATDGAGPWRRIKTQSGTTYIHTHRDLLPGTTHYYRVVAEKGSLISPWAYVQVTMPAIVGADGETVRFDPPLWPENLRFTSLDRTSVTLAWDPPANDGGSRVTGYEYRAEGPCASGSGTCDVKAPTRVGGTSARISGLNREGTYTFWVRALNAVGAGDWSQGIQKEVGSATAGGGRVIISPSRLTVTEGGQATYRVRLSRSPTQPIVVFLHWDGDEDLGVGLPFQQGKVLLPSGYDLSGLPDSCDGDHDWKENAHAWNSGAPITVTAAEDDDSENGKLTILHDLGTVSAACLGDPSDYAADPVYDGMFGLAIEVTERDKD